MHDDIQNNVITSEFTTTAQLQPKVPFLNIYSAVFLGAAPSRRWGLRAHPSKRKTRPHLRLFFPWDDCDASECQEIPEQVFPSMFSHFGSQGLEPQGDRRPITLTYRNMHVFTLQNMWTRRPNITELQSKFTRLHRLYSHPPLCCPNNTVQNHKSIQ